MSICNKCSGCNCECRSKCKGTSIDKCKPKCDPCRMQKEMLYCGKDNDCAGLKKGQTLSKAIETLGELYCDLKIRNCKNVNNLTNIQVITDDPECQGGVIIIFYDEDENEVYRIENCNQ